MHSTSLEENVKDISNVDQSLGKPKQRKLTRKLSLSSEEEDTDQSPINEKKNEGRQRKKHHILPSSSGDEDATVKEDMDDDEDEESSQSSPPTLLTETKLSPFVCPLNWCSRVLPAAATLERHINTHDRRVCGVCFRTVNGQARYVPPRSKAIKQTHFCDGCDLVFAYKWSLALHLKYNHLPEPLPVQRRNICITEGCGKIFPTKMAWKKHQTKFNHMDVTSTSSSSSRKHLCLVDECGKTFKTKTAWQRHKQTHTKHKPWPCPKCDKRYADKRNMMSHFTNHHAE